MPVGGRYKKTVKTDTETITKISDFVWELSTEMDAIREQMEDLQIRMLSIRKMLQAMRRQSMTEDQLHREVSRMARELADKDREIERLRAERDEARLECCRAVASNWGGEPKDIAKEHGWDCFPEATP